MANAAWVCIAFSVVLTITTVTLTRPLLVLMQTPEDILDGAVIYIGWIFASIPFIFLYNMVASIMRALGDSKTPLYFLILTSALNIGLDLLFIVPFKMGILGAALATDISQAISGVVSFGFLCRKFEVLHMQKGELAFSKHIHLPVQSGSDRLLKEMNRHYTVAQYMDLVDYAREKIPGVTFSSDIIVGFPGETEEDFQATLDLVRKVGYMQLFTFIYSKRTGTPAAKFDDPTTHAEKAARMERLLKTQDEFAFAATAAMAGQTVRVLVEAAGRTAGTVNGRLDNNLVVEFQAPESLIGQWANVHLTGSRAALLVGELVQD